MPFPIKHGSAVSMCNAGSKLKCNVLGGIFYWKRENKGSLSVTLAPLLWTWFLKILVFTPFDLAGLKSLDMCIVIDQKAGVGHRAGLLGAS